MRASLFSPGLIFILADRKIRCTAVRGKLIVNMTILGVKKTKTLEN